MSALVCLDKDGTLVHDDPYNVDPGRIRPMDGAQRALRLLAEAGFGIVVVTNQPGIGEGRFGEAELSAVHGWLQAFCRDAGARLDGFYYCPHVPDSCACRKPMPGLVLKALEEHDADAAASWLIGDILNDVEAGSRAGCRTILVDNGHETEWVGGDHRTPTSVQPDLLSAAARILQVRT